jgi:hypothetical protein
MACSDKAGTADRVKQATGALGDVLTGVGDYDPANIPEGVVTYGMRIAAAQMAVMAPVLEAVERLGGEVAALRGRTVCLPGDELLRCMGSGCGVVPHRRWPGRARPTWRCSECGEPRSGPREPEGVKVGDTFARGDVVCEVTRVTRGEPCTSYRLDGSGVSIWFHDVADLTGPSAQWIRVRAVEVAPRAEPGDTRLATAEELAAPDFAKVDDRFEYLCKDGAARGVCTVLRLDAVDDSFRWLRDEAGYRFCESAANLRNRGLWCPLSVPAERPMRVVHESGAAWGGMEPMDGGVADLDGPAGDERAGVPTDAAQALADMTAQRDAWEASCTSAAKELREAGEEIARLAKAWEALDSGYFTPARLDLNDAICALTARAVSW